MSKGTITLFATLGGTIGAYIPMLFGDSGLGGWSVLGAFVGGLIGIYAGFKFSQ